MTTCLAVLIVSLTLQGASAPSTRDRTETKPATAAKRIDPKVQRLLDAGNELYAKRDQEGMARKAIETWQKALAIDEGCADAYWRIARAHYWLGNHAGDGAKQQRLFKEGIEYAKLAVASDPENTAGHFWLGVMYGTYGQAVGMFQSLHMVEPIKSEMDWILKKDEGFDEGGAHRVLGRLYYKLPGFKGGDVRKAREHLRRAIELGPKNTLNYLYLAELHLEQGEREEARALLTKLVDLPDDPDYLPESRANKAKARELLKDMGEK